MKYVSLHGISTDEVLQPITWFKTFNQFFFRELKPGARKIESQTPSIILSPTDSRVSCFNTTQEGKSFTFFVICF